MTRLKILLTFLALSTLFVLASTNLAHITLAQGSEPTWSDPLNLSNTGSVSQPRIVTGSNGSVYVLWLDEYKGVYAMRQDDGQWSTPVQLMQVPMASNFSSLKLASGPDGLIHAAWLDKLGRLYYSWSDINNFTSPNGWTTARQVVSATADFDLSIDSSGNAHIVIIRSQDLLGQPVGIYTLRKDKGGFGFSSPHLVYASPYLRGLKADEIQVSISADQPEKVYVAWDEQPLEQVAMAVSADGGDTWSEPQLVDSRRPSDGDVMGPSRPWLAAQGDQAWLIWQAGHEGQACGQYYQASVDSGASWSEPQLLPAPLDIECVDNLQFLHSPQSGTYLLAYTPIGAYLLNWSSAPGSGWSVPQLQGELSGFTHPETYRPVTLGCQQGALQGTALLVVGCEGEKNGDIWLLERLLGELVSLDGSTPTPTSIPLWGTPAVLDSSEREIHSPLVVAEPSGRLHTFWTRQDSPEIYYSLWDGTRWTAPQTVLNSPGGAPLGITAALHPGGQLLVAWADTEDSTLYFSLVPAIEAIDPATWSAPQELPNPGAATAPQAIVLSEGRMGVFYAVPYNEKRGIYLVESNAPPQVGQAVEWLQPQMVFDAAAAGWDSLSDPRPAVDSSGEPHLLWTRYNLPPNSKATGLYEAHTDRVGGWTTPELVFEGEVVWSQLLAGLDGSLHRAWQGILGGQVVLFHQYSPDDGEYWSEAVRVGGSARTGRLAGMALDAGGRLNLLLLGENTRFSAGSPEQAPPQLQRWVWQGDVWQAAESEPLDELRDPTALSVVAPPPAMLAALYSGSHLPQEGLSSQQAGTQATPQTQYGLFLSRRELDDPPVSPAAVSTFTPGPSDGLQATETATPVSPQPTPTFRIQPEGGSSGGVGGSTGILIFGAIPAVLLVIGVFILLLRKRQGGKER